MSEQDDQNWFHTLAGRHPVGTDPATKKEAQAIRRAVLALKSEQEAAQLNVESGLQKLKFRLRREGLDGAPKRKSWQVYGAFAMAATMVLTIGVVMLQQPPIDDAATYRGAGAQIITTLDTTQRAQTLIAELEALGIKPEVTRFGAVTITAEWPAKPSAKHVAFLKRHNLQQPASSALRIELMQGNVQK